MKHKSKFVCSNFLYGYDDFACSQERFSKDQAIKLYIQEGAFSLKHVKEISIGRAYVRFRYGYDSDEQRAKATWWLEYSQSPRSCPVWVFHVTGTRANFENGYEIINLEEWGKTQNGN